MTNVDNYPVLAGDLLYRTVVGSTLSLSGDQPANGGVTFSISRTLSFPSLGVTVEPSSVKIRFKDFPNGTWGVNLPHIGNPATDDWGIWVKYSTRPYPYLIRVPAGVTPINILDIPEWRP